MDLNELTQEDFESVKGSTFRLVPGEGEPRDLVLAEVESLSPETAPPAGRRAPFSLVFQDPGPPGSHHQGIYRLEHPELGALDLFLVPIGPDAEGMRYQAIFT